MAAIEHELWSPVPFGGNILSENLIGQFFIILELTCLADEPEIADFGLAGLV